MKPKPPSFKILRSYITPDGEKFEVTTDFTVGFKVLYELGIPPDDVLSQMIEETDKKAKENYGAEPII